MKRYLLSFAMSLFFVALWAQKSDRHVVVLSLDAFRHDYPQMAHTPTLDSLARVGSSAVTRPPFPANTFPSHYSMATGLNPNNNGLMNNNFYDKRLERKFSMGDKPACFDIEFWGGEPLWSLVERNGLRSAVCMWVGSEVQRANYPKDVIPYNDKMTFRERADWVLAQMNRPVDSIPNLIMWYIEEPDGISHHFGPYSKETKQTVESLDSLLRYFFAEVKKSPVFDNTDFIVTADHGMAELSADRYINLFPLLDKSKVKYCYSGSPTLLEVAPEYKAQAQKILSAVPNVQVFVDGKLPEKYFFGSHPDRVPTFVLLPDVGYTLDYRPEDRVKHGGSHGFDPFDTQMKTIFFASGPDFKAGYVAPEFQNLNIYALIAHLLSIDPPANDGSIEATRSMLK